MTITDAQGRAIDETGPLSPGSGFLIRASLTVPPEDHRGHQPQPGEKAVMLLSVFQDPREVPDPTPHMTMNTYFTDIRPRYDMPGVGFALKTIVSDSSQGVVPSPPAVNDLKVVETGGSWVDLTWTSVATHALGDETGDDRSAMAYALRYSHSPITDESSWSSAVSVESVPAVLGPGNLQQYSLKGLNFETSYYTAIRAYNEDYIAGEIESVSFTTKPFDIDVGTGLTTSVSSKSAKRPASPGPNVPILQSTYPNPFASSTSIVYSLPNSSSVTIKIYNVLGQIVRVLVADSVQNVGSHTLNWDGRDTSGSIVPSGTYYVKMISGDSFSRRKIVFLR